MLLRTRKNKLRIWKILMALFTLGAIFFGTYALFALSKPLFITPLAKDAKSYTGNIEDLLTSSHVSFVSVSRAKDLSYEIGLKDGALVIISSKRDLNFQVSSLQQILKQLTIEGKELKSIDFRFDKPVIVFK